MSFSLNISDVDEDLLAALAGSRSLFAAFVHHNKLHKDLRAAIHRAAESAVLPQFKSHMEMQCSNSVGACLGRACAARPVCCVYSEFTL